MFHEAEDKIFSVRCASALAEAATRLAYRRGLAGRSRLVVELLRRELATEAGAGTSAPAQPGMEGTNEQQPA